MSVKSGNLINPNSIRQTIITNLMAGKSTKEIAELITASHPDSAAAKKSVKHIAWYRAWLKKNPVVTAD